MMKKYINGKAVTTIIFLIVIATIFLINTPLLCKIALTEVRAVLNKDNRAEFLFPKEVEGQYDANFYGRLKYIDINGAFSRVLGKQILNGAIKDSEGFLNLEDNTLYRFDEKTEKNKSDKAISIMEYAKESGAEVLYVQRPWKNSETASKLPYGIDLQYDKQFNFWCKRMEEKEIPILDLRNEMNDSELEFYKTDHHWTIQSSLIASDKIVGKLNDTYNMGLNKSFVNVDNYDIEVYKNCFLGSEGIKTGKYYVGKDDFEVINPKFNTSLKYIRYDHSGPVETRTGDFEETFISTDLITDRNYNNKYAAYTFDGYIENRIYNLRADNDLKVLLISDSFSRPMVTFFSLCFYETRYLDPQAGRYTNSYVEYIEKYHPDVVIMMFPGDGEFVEI